MNLQARIKKIEEQVDKISQKKQVVFIHIVPEKPIRGNPLSNDEPEIIRVEF